MEVARRNSAGYALEHANESERLEHQSKVQGYECEPELLSLNLKAGNLVLDAGCGSGVISRSMAWRWPAAEFIGCDSSATRVAQATKLASGIPNLSFVQMNLCDLKFPNAHFDSIVCRYVIHHLGENVRGQVLRELFRVLKPGGKITVLDPDNMFYTLFPQPEIVSRVLAEIQKQAPVDLCVGRKLPQLLSECGFSVCKWRVELICGSSDQIQSEALLMEQRFAQLIPFLSRVLGSETIAIQFRDEFLNALQDPAAMYYCNKVIVTATK